MSLLIRVQVRVRVLVRVLVPAGPCCSRPALLPWLPWLPCLPCRLLLQPMFLPQPLRLLPLLRLLPGPQLLVTLLPPRLQLQAPVPPEQAPVAARHPLRLSRLHCRPEQRIVQVIAEAEEPRRRRRLRRRRLRRRRQLRRLRRLEGSC